MRPMLFRRSGLLLGCGLLLLVSACGGGGSKKSSGDKAPTKLHYVPSAAATSSTWRLVADPATNDSSTLKLVLLGPSGAKVQGVTLFLRCEAGRAAWVQPTGATEYALPGTALDLSSGGSDASVKLFKTRLGSATDLQVGAYQKAGTATLGTDPVFTVSLRLASGATKGAVTLSVPSGKRPVLLDENGQEQDLSVVVGTLTAE